MIKHRQGKKWHMLLACGVKFTGWKPMPQLGIFGLLLVATCANAQTTITSLQPASCQPGVPTKLTLTGTKLPSNLRVLTNRTDVKIEVESVTDVQAILAVSVPSDSRPGPFGLWFATPSGPLATKIVLVDDLATVLDTGNNHSIGTAQVVSTLGSVDGLCEGPQFD